MASVSVGTKAPDFEAPAYQDGSFGQIKLSDYLNYECIVVDDVPEHGHGGYISPYESGHNDDP